jgi:hypothetical protein
MKATLFGLCAVLAAGVAQAQGAASLKPGLWEVRLTKMESDGRDMLPQMKAAQEQMRQQMAAMPPERRKQMEAALGQQGDPTVQRMCVSPEMAKNDRALLSTPSADCAPPKINRDGNRMTYQISCKQAGGAVDVTGEMVMASDQVSSKTQTIANAGGAKHTTSTEAQMKFVGGDCGGVKPMDQIVKEAQTQAAPKK